MYGAMDYNTLMDLLNGVDTGQPVTINNNWNFARAPTGSLVADNSITTAKLADNSVTAAKIVNGTIVDAEISASAAIAKSKLAALNIANADVASTAAIAYSKLNLANSVVNADIASAAAIAYSKLNLANSITKSDLIATAPNYAAQFFPSRKRTGIIQSYGAVTGSGILTGSTDAKSGSCTIGGLTPTAINGVGIQWTLGSTSGSFGGWRCLTGSGGNVVPANNPYLRTRFKFNSAPSGTLFRFWAGFNTATTVPTADEPLASTGGIYIGFRSTDSTWIICHNDGSLATSNFETGVMAAINNTNWHTLELWTDDAGAHWKYRLDEGTTNTSNTTQLPVTTTPLFECVGMTSTTTTGNQFMHEYSSLVSDSSG